MKIGIIGGGAIGLLMAGLLGTDGHSITLYVKREEQRRTLIEKGLNIQPGNKKIEVLSDSSKQLGKEELLIVCVKQHNLPEIIDSLKDNITPVLFLQNGMGHIDQLKTIEHNIPIYVGVVEHGAVRIEDNIVKQTGMGKVKFSSFNQISKDGNKITQRLNSTSFPIEYKENWYLILSEKLVINAVINPLTALFDVENGELITNRYLFVLASQLTKEVCHILKLDFENQWFRVRAICESTSSNISSMRADIKANRETEIESISGFLLKKVSTDSPYIEFTYHAIKALELRESNFKGFL